MRVALLGLGLLLLSAAAADTAPPAATAKPLRDHPGLASFTVGIDPQQYSVGKLTPKDADAAKLAATLPANATGFSAVTLRSTDGLAIQLAAATRKTKDGPLPSLAIQVGQNPAQAVALDAAIATGPLATLRLWSIAPAAKNGALAVLSFGASQPDVPLLGLRIAADGTITSLDLTGARTLGDFVLADLDGDGTYELITERNLDGWSGGITYRALRAFDAQANAYKPAPDKFKDFFRGELKYLDWVLDTRQRIAADPEQYMSREPRGWVYVAKYGEREVGFDSLVPLGLAEGEPEPAGDLSQWNGRVDSALKRVTDYRDELKAWVDGGAYPKAWQMAR